MCTVVVKVRLSGDSLEEHDLHRRRSRPTEVGGACPYGTVHGIAGYKFGGQRCRGGLVAWEVMELVNKAPPMVA
jgi:hypothetical protein